MADTPSSLHSYGWKASLPSISDFKFNIRLMTDVLPSRVDLRSELPSVWDQKSLGSCTAQSASALFWHTRKKLGKPIDWTPSRLFLYYNTRSSEKTTNYDAGASLRNTMKAMAKWGMCEEVLCPYDIESFKKKPSQAAYKAAAPNKIANYFAVPQDAQHLKSCLVEGFCVSFGFSVYHSLETEEVAKTGRVPLPSPTEQFLGGHAVLLCGYDDTDNCYIVRNSWGTTWGAGGYCYMPYEFVHSPNLALDFWTARSLA